MLHPRVESNPNIMFGKPVIKGTRITVELILEKMRNCWRLQENEQQGF